MLRRVLEAYEFYRNGSSALQDDVIRLVRKCERRSASGGNLYRAGDHGESLFFVGQGSIRVYISGPSGRHVTLYHVEPGQLCAVNLRGVMVSDELLANAKSEGDFEAVKLAQSGYQYLINHHQDFRAFIIESVTARFGDVIRQIADVTTRSVDYRLSRFLVHEAHDLSSSDTILVTNDEIAAEIGASREVVNRKLRAMQDVGVVKLGRGRIRVLDANKLKRFKKSLGQ